MRDGNRDAGHGHVRQVLEDAGEARRIAGGAARRIERRRAKGPRAVTIR